MWTNDKDRKKVEKKNKEIKNGRLKSFDLSGEMTVKLPNGIIVEISSLNSDRVVFVSQRKDNIRISEKNGQMKVATEFFQERVGWENMVE